MPHPRTSHEPFETVGNPGPPVGLRDQAQRVRPRLQAPPHLLPEVDRFRTAGAPDEAAHADRALADAEADVRVPSHHDTRDPRLVRPRHALDGEGGGRPVLEQRVVEGGRAHRGGLRIQRRPARVVEEAIEGLAVHLVPEPRVAQVSARREVLAHPPVLLEIEDAGQRVEVDDVAAGQEVNGLDARRRPFALGQPLGRAARGSVPSRCWSRRADGRRAASAGRRRS